MKKELPKVFANDFDKKIDNIQEVYYGNNRVDNTRLSYDEIITKANNLFKSSSYVYKVDCKLKINNQIIDKTIIGRTKNGLITRDNEIIKFSDIEDIIK
ncbi:MAG: hypothetical protein IJ574_04805 [Bacilli bacterium]|nr:hypothetical protein [Bacilli bacterium]